MAKPTPRTDAYLASRAEGKNTKSWVEFARELELEIIVLLADDKMRRF